MPRTDNDSWDITESVGATALGVAAARAAETESENPLVKDPFARVFVDAAGEGIWSVFADPRLLAQAADIEPEVRSRVRAMIDFMATRTAFFDEFFLGAADAGVRQVVILAAGLDARAWRLPWPDGTVVYELDQPKVLDFKTATLRRHGARPTSRLVTVPIDLRQDWPKALQETGFDTSKPSAWSAEACCATFPRRPKTSCSSASMR
ncbi:putative S-adenosyl-L-methionine-dependent methyltransferase ML2640 [Mycobacterium kansasii]|uniref:S-adenosyl-L-methionine-dependent methyltransferase n=1 Tax=Mycobacterium kansasii TaxID=1768 RepID=A0A1V3XC30_MYCKA|nr:putative S-adenosyl-L-methionine-dependent methyltransferase ML2640 [Mycobacterium kansasii]